MDNTQVTRVKDLIVKGEKVGYAQALNDLMSEIKLKKADGFVIDELVVWELIEFLVGRNNKVE